MKAIKIFLFWLIQWTWGFMQNFIGLIFLIKSGALKHEFYHGDILTSHKGEWGGVSLGVFIFVNDHRGDVWQSQAVTHEYGHSIQSLILGPFYMFVIGIPSFVWCNSKRGKEARAKGVSYYDFYPEKWANKLGAKALNKPIPDWEDKKAAETRAVIAAQKAQNSKAE